MSATIINGGILHYEMIGRGQPVIFLHGWLGSWRYWMPTMQAISGNRRSYALDWWGFGDSDKSKARYKIADYVTLLDQFVTALGIDRPALVGHSLGAVVMLDYALRYPERVNSMVVVNLPMNLACINRKLMNFTNNSMIAKLLWWRDQKIYPEVQQETDKADQEAITSSLQSLAQINMRRRLQHLSELSGAKLLAIYGANDHVIDPEPIRRLNGDWSNIRPMGLDQSEHFPMLDEAAKFQRLLKDFLEVEECLGRLELTEEWRRRTR